MIFLNQILGEDLFPSLLVKNEISRPAGANYIEKGRSILRCEPPLFMEHRGIEPLTSRLRTWRSPS